jgi:hypothetical protein
VSQEIQDRNAVWQRTIHGIGHVEESDDGSWEAKFVAIGARVGRRGQVFEANDCADLVVKLFTWAAGLPAEVVQNFTRDVIRVADLRHPNVVQVVDAGMLGDGTPFVVMERLAGVTLDEAMSGRSLPITEVLPILRGVGAALSAAHAAGVAHGQLRADNVFITDAVKQGPSCPKLLDFGVARLMARTHEIGPGADALGHRAAERADQLALATLAWRFLGSMSAPFQRVLLRAMSPDPSQRFRSVAALVEALEEASASAAGGLAMKVGAVRTLAGGSPPLSPNRLAPAVGARPSGLDPSGPPPAAATPVLAAAPSSLTQQFFAEGEQLEMAHVAGQRNHAQSVAEADEEGELETAAARVPRSRVQMTAAALLALGSVAIIGWTVVSLASKPDGGRDAAGAVPATALAHPVAVPPAGALRGGRTTERGLGAKTIQVRRAPPVQPPPFAAPAKPSVAASEAPAPPRSEVLSIPAPRPWVDSPSAATEATTLPSAAPGEPRPAAAPVERNDDETQVGDEAGEEPRGAAPATNTPGAAAAAPPTSDETSPAPSAPEASTPSAPAPPTAH